MRRTAWILAALGLAGSYAPSFAQDAYRTTAPVRRPAASPSSNPTARQSYAELFADLEDEPESRPVKPVARSLKQSMSSSSSAEELLGKQPSSTPLPAQPSEAFPGSKSRQNNQVSAAALFVPSDAASESGAPGAARNRVMKAEAPSTTTEDGGKVTPVIGFGRPVSTSTNNRNQRVLPRENTGAPTDVDNHLLMIDELPVDPKAPASPPKSAGRAASTLGELPELDFSTTDQELEAERESAMRARKSAEEAARAPQSRRTPAQPVKSTRASEEAPLTDNPFAQYANSPSAPAEPAASEMPAARSSAIRRTSDEYESELTDLDPNAEASPTMPPLPKRKTVVDPPIRPMSMGSLNEAADEEEDDDDDALLRELLADDDEPAAQPAATSRSMNVPATRQQASTLFQKEQDEDDSEPAAAPAGRMAPATMQAEPQQVEPQDLFPKVEQQTEPAEVAPAMTEPAQTASTSASSLSELLATPAPTEQPSPSTPPTQQAPAGGHFISSEPQKISGPGVTAQWVKKSEITIGQECLCELVVKNQTNSDVRDVEVEAHLPANVQLVSTTPAPERNQATLIWKFESLAAGESKPIAIRMIPRERGQIATQAFVRFANMTAGTFSVSEPMLSLELAGPNEVMIGETASHTVMIRNPGTGTASNVRIEARIPDGLEHARGKRLAMDLGALNPGESRPVRLALAAINGGRHVIEVKAQADGEIMQVAASEVNVIAPKLKAEIQGPGLRYLGRRAVYRVLVTNDGSSVTENVRVMHKIPEGFEYVSCDKGASYNASNRMLSWFVGSLKEGETSESQVTLTATAAGTATHFIRATSEHGVVADTQVTTQVEGAAALIVEIADLDDPVEIGVETGYEIRVKNDGSAPADKVVLHCEIPAGSRFISASGAVAHTVSGQVIEFRPLAQLAPGETARFQVIVKGEKAGNLRFRTHLTSGSITEPLISEELTKFYGE